jgi:hypothetical protein
MGTGNALALDSPCYRPIRSCRLCDSDNLLEALDLGTQSLTGIFPRQAECDPPAGPLRLLRCESCGLVQLAHNYDLTLLYGNDYGYRSGLNKGMVRHLANRVRAIEARVDLRSGDTVLDIGSNDGTLLSQYASGSIRRVGIDPTARKFRQYYPADVTVVEDFFTADVFRSVGSTSAKAITSISMFYDLEHPMSFVRQIGEVLHAQGVWVFEQSYLPAMLASNAYDTICHEHLEYYGLRQILYLLRREGLKIVDLEFNNVNGGSFCVTAAKQIALYPEVHAAIEEALVLEQDCGLQTNTPFERLRAAMQGNRDVLRRLLTRLRDEGKTVRGYGASTKGNVLLQYCGIDRELLPEIVEVNEDKIGAMTPGTRIPVVAENDATREETDFFLVLPWHFRNGIIAKESLFLAQGGGLIFPLPEVEIVTSTGVQALS